MKYMLVGGSSGAHLKVRPNPQPAWLQEKSWHKIQEIEQELPDVFHGLADSFASSKTASVWKKVFESTLPESEKYPEQYGDLSAFNKFYIIQALRPDRLIAYSRIYVSQTLGPEYIQPQTFNLEKSFKDSTNLKPILFLLNDMADPMQDLMTFADSMRMGRKIQVLSLGRGIEKTAITLIDQFVERGNWAVLQNCHLSVKFLKMLEVKLEELQQDPGQVHRDFRLFLTSQPTGEFPVNVLQNSVKVSVENPNNLKANLLRVWENNITDKQL